jgi:branched-chain amino acid transport system substrate-binding protein
VVVAAALVAGVGVALARNGGGGSGARPPVVHTTTTTARSVVFGVIQPQTGVDADFAPTMRAPVVAAVRDINRAGGVNGDRVRAVFADDGSTNAGASVALRSLIAQHARVVLGPASSNIASSIMDELATAPVAACSGSTTSSTLLSAPDRGRFFRTVADDKMQAVALAQLVLADGHRNVALLSRSGEGFAAVAQIVSKVLTEGGARIVARPPDYIVQADDFSEQTDAVAAAHPDAVVLVATEPDARKLIPALDALGVGPNQVATYATDDLRGQTFARDVDATKPGIVAGLGGTLPASFVTETAPQFVKALQGRGDDSVMAAYYYDCTMLAALAADEAGPGDANGDALRQHFVDVSTGGTKCTTYARCAALLRDGADIDYDGLTGPVDLDAAGNVRSARFKVWRYRADGRLVGVDRAPIAVDASAVPAL